MILDFMEEYTLKEIITLISPLLLVFIAGGIALYNQRQSIKLQARNKWKEDFRLHVSDYLEAYMTALFNTTSLKASPFGGAAKDHSIANTSLSLSQLTSTITKIQMMLDKDSQAFKEIDELARSNNEKLTKIVKGDIEASNIEDTLKKFFEAAKKIYDNKK
ncbi:hypothetical protein [Salinimicrobium xinjiangense]|uniref:hypothetical protein n=1 Tax=Salinimicrobium xinjiangense TaxID=438596 RepID=UPI0012EB5AEA|nr:hypothetical protein [Salinimicrobium xinjiangense]